MQRKLKFLETETRFFKCLMRRLCWHHRVTTTIPQAAIDLIIEQFERSKINSTSAD